MSVVVGSLVGGGQTPLADTPPQHMPRQPRSRRNLKRKGSAEDKSKAPRPAKYARKDPLPSSTAVSCATVEDNSTVCDPSVPTSGCLADVPRSMLFSFRVRRSPFQLYDGDIGKSSDESGLAEPLFLATGPEPMFDHSWRITFVQSVHTPTGAPPASPGIDICAPPMTQSAFPQQFTFPSVQSSSTAPASPSISASHTVGRRIDENQPPIASAAVASGRDLRHSTPINSPLTVIPPFTGYPSGCQAAKSAESLLCDVEGTSGLQTRPVPLAPAPPVLSSFSFSHPPPPPSLMCFPATHSLNPFGIGRYDRPSQRPVHSSVRFSGSYTPVAHGPLVHAQSMPLEEPVQDTRSVSDAGFPLCPSARHPESLYGTCHPTASNPFPQYAPVFFSGHTTLPNPQPANVPYLPPPFFGFPAPSTQPPVPQVPMAPEVYGFDSSLSLSFQPLPHSAPPWSALFDTLKKHRTKKQPREVVKSSSNTEQQEGDASVSSPRAGDSAGSCVRQMDRVHSCPFCHRTFTFPNSLAIHLKWHWGASRLDWKRGINMHSKGLQRAMEEAEKRREEQARPQLEVEQEAHFGELPPSEKTTDEILDPLLFGPDAFAMPVIAQSSFGFFDFSCDFSTLSEFGENSSAASTLPPLHVDCTVPSLEAESPITRSSTEPLTPDLSGDSGVSHSDPSPADFGELFCRDDDVDLFGDAMVDSVNTALNIGGGDHPDGQHNAVCPLVSDSDAVFSHNRSARPAAPDAPRLGPLRLPPGLGNDEISEGSGNCENHEDSVSESRFLLHCNEHSSAALVPLADLGNLRSLPELDAFEFLSLLS